MHVVRNQLIIIVLCLVPYASWGDEKKLALGAQSGCVTTKPKCENSKAYPINKNCNVDATTKGTVWVCAESQAAANLETYDEGTSKGEVDTKDNETDSELVERTNKWESKDYEGSDSKCKTASRVGFGGCEASENYSKVQNQLTQASEAAGVTALQTIGEMQALEAEASGEVDLASQYEMMAKQADQTAAKEVTLGVLHLGGLAAQTYMAGKHGAKAKALRGIKARGDTSTGTFEKSFDLGSKYKESDEYNDQDKQIEATNQAAQDKLTVATAEAKAATEAQTAATMAMDNANNTAEAAKSKARKAATAAREAPSDGAAAAAAAAAQVAADAAVRDASQATQAARKATQAAGKATSAHTTATTAANNATNKAKQDKLTLSQNFQEQKNGEIDSDVKALAGVSAGEQEDARDAATMGAFNSGVQFLVKGVGAASAVLTAKQLRELAASVSETDDSEDSEISWDMSDADADSAARTGSVTGTEVATSAATEAEAEEEELEDYGPGYDPDDSNELADGAPAPGAFNLGSSGGGGSGGGLPGMSAGSTSSDGSGEAEQAEAKMADTGSGAGYAGGGYAGGKRGGGGGDDDGIDLAGLLAQFLPKAEEEDKKTGIEEYGAKEAGPGDQGLLGRDVNLFQRLHDVYQKKAKSGAFLAKKG